MDNLSLVVKAAQDECTPKSNTNLRHFLKFKETKDLKDLKPKVSAMFGNKDEVNC